MPSFPTGLILRGPLYLLIGFLAVTPVLGQTPQGYEARLLEDTNAVVALSFDDYGGKKAFATLSSERLSAWVEAAEQGNGLGQFLHGMNYLLKEGRVDQAKKLLSASEGSGCVFATVALGVIADSGSDPAIVERFRKASDAGLAWGQYKLGVKYSEGKAIKRDEKEAFRLIKTAALQGLTVAMCDLAGRFEKGLGCEEDIEKAESFYRKAAEQGDAISQNNYAVLLVKKNKKEEANKWFQKAAGQGNGLACYNLGLFFEFGVTVPKNLDTAASLYTIGMQKAQDGDCTYRFGILNLSGLIRWADPTVGLDALRLAGSYGCSEAEDLHKAILAEMRRSPNASRAPAYDYSDKWNMPPEAQYQELRYQRRENAEMNRHLP